METGKSLPRGQKVVKRFIYYAALGVPEVDEERYRLTVSGLVEKPQEYSYQELMRMIDVNYVRDFHCVTGWSVLGVSWEGVSLRNLLQRSVPKKEAEWVMFYSLDGYTTAVPLEDAMSEDAVVVLKMNGKPLTREQGFPARPFIPHLYAWKSAKWLASVELLPDYVDGYWEERGYHERGNVWEEERFKGQGGKHLPRRPLL